MLEKIKKILVAIDGYKTYIVAGVTVVYALVSWWSGAIDWKTAMDMILVALGAGSFRSAIKKVETLLDSIKQ